MYLENLFSLAAKKPFQSFLRSEWDFPFLLDDFQVN